jgi:hypothetical protein
MYRYLTSETIALEATDSDTSFNIHEGLLRSISPALAAACNQEWKEGTLRRYKFREDVTEQTLLSFLTWAYCGDYQANGDDIPSSVNQKAETNVSEDDSIKKWKKKKRTAVIEDEDASWVSSSVVPIFTQPLPGKVLAEYGEGKAEKTCAGPSKDTSLQINLATAEDKFIHPLLSHAKLYVFANMYLIEPLKVSAKQEMVNHLQKLGNLSVGNQ